MSRNPTGTSRKRKPALGLDPLTWMREDDAAAPAPEAATTLAEAPAGTEPAPLAESAGAGPIVLDAEIGIGDSSALYERLAAALDGGGALRLDGARVEAVDGAALQLLTVFCREAGSRGRRVEWAGVSQRLADTARVTGLAGALGMPAASA